jgi:hypothetical protein
MRTLCIPILLVLGSRCDGEKAREAPDLMAWDSAARANLDRLRKQGVVAVRYGGKANHVISTVYLGGFAMEAGR